MATQAKLTIKRGALSNKDVTLGAGTEISGSDAIEINIDQTKMTRGECAILLEQARDRVLSSPWPLV